MTLSNLAVYTTAHGIDPVKTHIVQLEDADVSPDIVGLELPDVDDVNENIDSFVHELAKRSPSTAFTWYIVERINKKAYQSTSDTADRGDSEFEAGKQYADRHDIPHISVDLGRHEIAERYATWPRRIRDSIVLLIGLLVAMALWLIAVGAVLNGLATLYNYGFSSRGVGGITLGILFAVGLTLAGRFTILYAVGKIGYWFRDALREIRDEAMYENLSTRSAADSPDTGLLIVGAAHFSGIKSIAEADGTECWQIESPAITRYDGELDGLSPSELSEIATSPE
jgi:hypothetical protein